MSNSLFIIKYSNSRSDDLDELVNTDSDDGYDINPIRSSIYFLYSDWHSHKYSYISNISNIKYRGLRINTNPSSRIKNRT